MFSKIASIFQVKSFEHYLVDLHSHLIPGIDDGSKNMEETIELIKTLKELGFEKIITTPHIMSHRFPNTSAIILDGLSNVKEELKRQGIKIELEAASEYYCDEHFEELIDKRDILTFGENYVLFEMSYVSKPVNLESVIHEMKVAGYKPVLAHPERYVFMHDNFEAYNRLLELGVLFQINLNSLSGYYSKVVEKVAHKLIKKGCISFIGSDTHKKKQLEYFTKNINSKIVSKIFENNTILNKTLL